MPTKISIVNETKDELPPLPFQAIKNTVLGSRYELSVVVVPSARMKELNAKYRNLEEPTDILSFALSGAEGEIYLCLPEAKKESRKFDRPYENFLGFLFIHGCVHLKGYDHGSTMERIETQVRKKFKI